MAQELELYSSDYDEIRVVVAGAAVVKGEFDTYNDTNGFYGFAAGAIGAEMALVVKASKVLVKKEAPLVINVGDEVYFDATAREADKTNTNVLIGSCAKAALSADTHVLVNFDGNAAFLKV